MGLNLDDEAFKIFALKLRNKASNVEPEMKGERQLDKLDRA
jgi:hypothetical protein